MGPHPDMANRMFVLEPLAELCPLLSMSRESVYNAVRRERAFLQRVDCSTSLLWELEVIPEK